MSNEENFHPPSRGSNIRVLVVDDSQVSRSQLQGTLVEAGIQVVEAEDGQEALWRARTERFDLVLTDVHMPTMDGLTLASRLREMKEYESTPILALTSDHTRERLEAGRDAGITAWMLKPTKLELLAETVRRAIMKS